MKISPAFIGIIAMSVTGFGAGATATPHPGAANTIAVARKALADPASNHIITVAHRACWEHAPENSRAAIEACINLGVDAVENDVRRSRDGVQVIMHDETVDRTTNGHGKVADLTWPELAQLRLREGRGGPSAPLTSQRVLTLDQYLAAAKNRLMIVFDVKDGTQVETFRHIEKAGTVDQAIFFYECVDHTLWNAIAPFRDRVITIPIMFGKDGPLAAAAAQCPSSPAGWAHVKWTDNQWLEQVAADQERAPIRLWTATMFPADNAGHDDALALRNPDAVWGDQIRHGARMIMTNKPTVLMSYLKSR